MNRVRAAHDALWAALPAAFPAATLQRNPATFAAPKPRSDGLAQYIALIDDAEPEVVSAFAGAGGYDLKATPTLVFGYLGLSKDARQQHAWGDVAALALAFGSDLTLGGAVEHVQTEAATPADAGEADWLAGGLELRVRLLFNAPTPAG